MRAILRSLWTWAVSGLLIVGWFPLLAGIRLFDRDPVHYRTGRWFRRLGVLMTNINPLWNLTITGETIDDPRRPYVVVSNHQSFADIPFISRLPWEMKWMAKDELFALPFAGWMMRIAGDIPVKRGSVGSSKKALEKARWYLDHNCSVIIFPEGTRSPGGRILRFTGGAFTLAMEAGVPILPLVIDGAGEYLPRDSWLFGPAQTVRLHLLPPISTKDFAGDANAMRQQVREQMIQQLAAMRGVPPEEVDAYSS